MAGLEVEGSEEGEVELLSLAESLFLRVLISSTVAPARARANMPRISGVIS